MHIKIKIGQISKKYVVNNKIQKNVYVTNQYIGFDLILLNSCVQPIPTLK